MKHRTILFTTLIVLFLAALGGDAARSQTPAPTPSSPPQSIEELQQEVRKILTKQHVPGAGIALVATDHVIWTGGVGKADIRANQDVTADTIFRVGSISKSFVALALLKLQEEGKLDLNAKLADVAPDIPVNNPWEATHPIRIVNLLEHTAGFDDMHPSGAYNALDSPDIPLLRVLQRFASPLTSRWPPGTRMSYSNPDYGIAGYLIEKITKQPYDLYIRENILLPLGMQNSDFRLTNLNQPLLAKGYTDDSARPVPYVSIYLRPAGDLKSSPTEMAHFVQMMLNRGKLGDVQIVKPESIDRMESPQTTIAARAGLKAGYGLANYTDLNEPVVIHGHNGGIDGFLSSYGYNVEHGIGFVVFINSTNSPDTLRELTKVVVRHLVAGQPTPQQPAVSLSEAELEQVAGYYEKANPRNQMFAFADSLLGGRRIFVSGGKLFQKNWIGKPTELIPVAANQFRHADQVEASSIFCADEDGTPVFTDMGTFGRKTGIAWPAIRLCLVLAALALMASAVVFALVWIPRKLMKRMKDVRHLSVRYVPLLAVLSLGAGFFLLNAIPSWLTGTYNILTVAVWLLTWAFAVLSLWGLWLAVRSFRLAVKPAVRIHSLLVAVACCGLANYLYYWHIIGLRLWAP
jgi:CubicO group peptidase (beta-lactamase class C family)